MKTTTERTQPNLCPQNKRIILNRTRNNSNSQLKFKMMFKEHCSLETSVLFQTVTGGWRRLVQLLNQRKNETDLKQIEKKP